MPEPRLQGARVYVGRPYERTNCEADLTWSAGRAAPALQPTYLQRARLRRQNEPLFSPPLSQVRNLL